MQALLLDVKNYDAFRELVEGSMMSSSEGESMGSRDWADSRMGIYTQSLLSLSTLRGAVTFRQAHLQNQAEESESRRAGDMTKANIRMSTYGKLLKLVKS